MIAKALEIRGLTASIGDLKILKGVDLDVPFGEIHALMGPNGSGKSTLCHALTGKAEYRADGSALVGGTEVLGLAVDERVRAGLFQTFQYPIDVAGVTLRELLDEMEASITGGNGFRDRVEANIEALGMEPFIDRSVNDGLSGGEKKRSEIFQLMARMPTVAMLDEIDSGLDIDAVREVAAAVESLRSTNIGILIITHYSRILRYLTVDKIHVMLDGRVVRSGGAEVADELESKGYESIRAELGLAAPIAETAPDPFEDL